MNASKFIVIIPADGGYSQVEEFEELEDALKCASENASPGYPSKIHWVINTEEVKYEPYNPT